MQPGKTTDTSNIFVSLCSGLLRGIQGFVLEYAMNQGSCMGKGQYGGQTLPQSITSQEQARDSQSQWQFSMTPAYSQSSQALDLSQSSQVSCSSCWDASIHRQTNQRECHDILLDRYSEGNTLETLPPQPSQALSFNQCEVLQTDTGLSQNDQYTLTLQTPQRISESQPATWKSSRIPLSSTVLCPALGYEPWPALIFYLYPVAQHPGGVHDCQQENWVCLQSNEEDVPRGLLLQCLVLTATEALHTKCSTYWSHTGNTLSLLRINELWKLSKIRGYLESPLSHCPILSSVTQNEFSNSLISTSKLPHRSPLKPSFTLKRKYEAPQPQTVSDISSISAPTKRPQKWEPPRSSQEQKRDAKTKTYHNKMAKLSEKKRNEEIKLCSNPKPSSCVTKVNKQGPEEVQLDPNQKEFRNQSKPKLGSLTSSLTSDPRVTDACKMSQDDMDSVINKAKQSEALVLTLVFRDGTTQLDPEQKQTPPVCGLLLLIKTDLESVRDTLAPNDRLIYLKLEHAPTWAKPSSHHLQETFTRDLLLQVFSTSQLVVCYKAKDLLRVVLQLYKRELTWKQVERCLIQDPQLSGWLLDPTDPATCFQDLLNKHCKDPRTTPALGPKKVSQMIAGLYSLYKLNRELCSKLQTQGLWRLYADMELKMIPVLAAMEVCHVHVDKEALKRTSDLLGTKMKQLEQEAHKAAGQMFLLTSSTQLRTVLFEKLRLHERCENKKLPKTINKQQSTSEAALLQLQDLHPLPKIILEYRQIHKIKSTFVDGILSCMMTKSYISSTWHQTSAVTGRISATHPNFQALPRQPLQVTRKLFIAGKEDEVVTVHPRAMFIPKEGWTFLSADFCQVELRLLAHLSSDPELLRIFTDPEADVFSMLASQWKGVSESEVSSEDREHAKRIVYSVVYGAGPERLSGILGVSTEQARKFQDSFLQTYIEVQNFIQKTVADCQRKGSAADLCKTAMIRIFNLLSTSSSLSARLIAQLHDELLYEVEDSQVEQFAAVVRSTMESLKHIDQLNIHLKVPLKVAVSSGKSWGSMCELIVPRSHPFG
ncbi:hypothetical protein WMY93_015010 [Mugilogobius chulae]|uniref:DNA-directed DNA polymerase n=1 Tax=Mugilogobius chulae TaxID=88201 RepID=A0AAW0P0K0_9GOBI